MDKTSKVITIGMLRARHACDENRKLFLEIFPNGTVELTTEVIEAHAHRFPISWAAERFLPREAFLAWQDNVIQSRQAKNDGLDAAWRKFATAVNELPDGASTSEVDAAYDADVQAAEAAYSRNMAHEFVKLFKPIDPTPIGRAIDDLSTTSVFEIAGNAGVYNPDTNESPGAQFIETCRTDVLDYLGGLESTDDFDADKIKDEAHIWASQTVDNLGTHEVWEIWTDLALYREDIRDHGAEDMGSFETPQRMAERVLMGVADRILHQLADEAEHIIESAADDDE